MIKKSKKNMVAAPSKSDDENHSDYSVSAEQSDQETSDEQSESDDNSSDDGFSEQDDELNTKETNSSSNKRKTDQKNVVAQSAKKPKTLEKIKPPTLEEINELKETRNLFHSNLFRLQVKEMLTELKIKDKYSTYVITWLESFALFLKQLTSEPEKQDANKLSWLRKSPLQLPLSLEKLGAQLQKQKPFNFQFIKPTEAPYVMGAAATNTLLGDKLIVDVAVTMPAECLQKDNFLNLVYEQKRAIYLTYIADKLLTGSKHFEALSVEQLQFSYFANNPLKPVLELEPPASAGKLRNKLSFRIFVAAAENSFKLNRFVPWNNNVRATLFGDEEDAENATPIATPNYNAGVLFDLTMQSNQQLLASTFAAHKNLQEGLLLVKVWLQQRQLHVGFSGFQHHIMAMFIVHLYKQRKLHNNMSSYQVARNVWNHLAHSTWDEAPNGITLCAHTETPQPNQPTLAQFHAHYDVVFVDVSGFYNLCANLSLEVYRRVRIESKLAVDTLNDMNLNSFQLIFMSKMPVYTHFDHVLKINKSDVVEQLLSVSATPAVRYNYACNAQPQLLQIVTTLLRKGLDQRLHALLPIEQLCATWPASATPALPSAHLHLGLILNAQHAYEVLDKGPESYAPGAEEFRQFWGEAAQLRRFQDGTITEAVVWGAHSDALAKKRLVVRKIVLYLLKLHLQLEATDVQYLAGEFDVAFQLTPLFKTDKMYEKNRVEQDNDAESLSLNVIRSFDDLGRKLSSLHDLPLEIVSIGGVSPVFRYCEPQPVLPQARLIKEQIYANNVHWGVVQLGLSGKWPGELAALRALKTAFYIQIASMLRDKFKLHTKVTLDGIMVLKQGYVFGIEIAHPKEAALLKRERTERGITKYVDCEASIALEKRHYMLPKVTSALHGLYQLHPSFGAAVMIAKRWLNAHYIDDGLWPTECTELLIAGLYLRTNAQQLPCQAQTGFFRFLQLLAHTDWKTELFLINFNNEMNENTISELENRFNTERDAFPPLCIATAYDMKHYGLVWSTNLRPNVNILARVTILARQALVYIKEAMLSTDDNQLLKATTLFTTSNRGYDLVIQLKPDIVPNSLCVEFRSPFTAFTRPNYRLPLAGTNYLQDAVARLREAYSDYAAFFYNPCGGKEIAVLWKPNIFEPKEFKVNEVNGCALSGDGAKVQCKREIFIEDFKVILKDFYLRMGSVQEVLKDSTQTATKTNALFKIEAAARRNKTNVVQVADKSIKLNELAQKLAPQMKKQSNTNVKIAKKLENKTVAKKSDSKVLKKQKNFVKNNVVTKKNKKIKS